MKNKFIWYYGHLSISHFKYVAQVYNLWQPIFYKNKTEFLVSGKSNFVGLVDTRSGLSRGIVRRLSQNNIEESCEYDGKRQGLFRSIDKHGTVTFTIFDKSEKPIEHACFAKIDRQIAGKDRDNPVLKILFLNNTIL